MSRSPRASLAPRVLVVLCALLLTVPVAAAAQPSAQPSEGELRDRLERAERDAGRLDDELSERRSELSGAEEQLAAVGARLADARGRLRAAEGRLALADQAARDAEEERVAAVEAAEVAQEELEAITAELAVEEAALADQAIAAYKFGSVGARAGSVAFDVVRRAGDPNELAVGMHQIGRAIGDQGVTVDRVAELQLEQATQAEEARRAQRRAAELAQEAEERLQVTETLREEAAVLTGQVEDEEANQAALTAELRGEVRDTAGSLERISARQAELGRELAQRRAEREAAERAAAEREAARRAAEEEARRERENASSGGSSDSSGGSSGGATQGGGGGGGGPSMSGVCPVVGAVAGRDFTNDWGDPRSGGRTHQGNDIFADRGTSIVAIADGVVVRVNRTASGLGGLTVTYRTGEGSEWYNAHLDSVADGISPGVPVTQGQRVGTVGDSGNARGTPPHNHIGRRYDGEWVNPWPTISPMCR